MIELTLKTLSTVDLRGWCKRYMFRHRVEGAISSVTSFVYTMRPWQLYDLPSEISEHMKRFHIYFICRGKRTTVLPNSFRKENGFFHLDFKIEEGDTFVKRSVGRALPYDLHQMKFETKYPFNTFRLLAKDEEVLYDSSGFYARYKNSEEEANLEVIYIGQSYGEQGDRGAQERLLNHSTLQKILAEAQRDFADSEIWISILEFNPNGIMFMNGQINSQSSEEEDIDRFKTFTTISVGEEHIVNFTEAALIRYFQPHYNKMYKNNFPDPNHLTYRECYQVDLNTIGFEINIPNYPWKFWSDAIPPVDYHAGIYSLLGQEDRIKFFNLDEVFINKTSVNIISN